LAIEIRKPREKEVLLKIKTTIKNIALEEVY
jgi:hypothetical protein